MERNHTACRQHGAEAAECHLEGTGKLVFYTGFAPPVGEQIAGTSHRG